MNQVKTFALRIFTSLFVLSTFFAAASFAQQGLEPAPKLPAGMKGSNAADPRAKLSPGLFDAGEASMGMKHLQLFKKPAAFQLGSDDPNSENVKKTLGTLGVPDASMIPEPVRLVFAQLAFANSDMAFQGNKLFLGNFYGVNIFDISQPSNTKLVTSMVCPGGQGDVSVYKNLMFMSVEMPNGRLDCSVEGFPPHAMPAKGEPMKPDVQKDRFRGVRIFDISDITKPKQVGQVQTCRGSHTHTLVVDPKDKDNVYVYVSGTSFVRPGEELAGCSGEAPSKNPETALFRIEVIKVPVAAPQNSKIVSSPRVFIDPRTGAINGLNNGGSHDSNGRVADTDQCHDITVYSELGLAAGACSGNGILLDIKDPANPKRIDAVNDPNYSYWHSATFSNDGKKVVFTDEWGGGMGARCRENDPNVWGANAIFNLENNKLNFANYYKMPSAQGDSENCVAHNGSLIPVPGRDLEIQAWYQGGVSVMDFTDAKNPMEIAYFDRGPIDPKMLILGGSWSAYWYNGNIYSSEIARGLDVFELTPTEFLTQNEIDAAKANQVAELNVQNQQRIVYPNKLIVAKAYLDQLERSNAMPKDKIGEMRLAVQSAESSKLGGKDKKKLKGYVSTLEKSAADSKNSADSNRMNGLAMIFKNPMM
ncbi:MAG TPA: hypothetical protein PKY59_09900 [Pyrinomonadaceae bacterium]|nr:hypothetical protein [Pyrinomonadaceae bacterium]